MDNAGLNFLLEGTLPEIAFCEREADMESVGEDEATPRFPAFRASSSTFAQANLFILQNAGVHARTRVIVTLVEHEPDGLRLCVEDDGDGIPLDERGLVTRPFVRGTAQRHDAESESAGHGLGLAVVARIAEWHNAHLKIDSSESLGGAAIEVFFVAN